MSLSSMFPSGYILEKSTKNIISRYRNRERCINSVFWTMYDQLDNGQSSVLVVDKKEDLENLNYLLSKYGLRELSLIVSDSQWINKTYLMSKANEEDKIRPRLGMRIADFNKAKHLYELEYATLKSCINKLRIPLMGNLSIAEINDRIQFSSTPKVDVEEAILRPPYTYENYLAKKSLYKQLESRYDSNYQFVSMNDPFSETIFLEADIDAVKSVIKDYLNKAHDLLADFEEINRTVLESFNSKNFNKDAEIKSQLANVISLMQPHQQLTDTDVTKLVSYQGELYKLLNISSPVPVTASDLISGLEKIESEINKRLTSQYSATQENSLRFLEQLSGSHPDFPQLENLISSVNKLTDQVIDSEVFKENLNQKSVAFAFQKVNLQNLIKKLAYALYFIEEHTVYLEWKVMSKDLTKEDHTITTYLANQGLFWDEAFQNLFLQYYLNHTKPTLDSVGGGDKINYLRQDYLRDYPAVLLEKYLGQAGSMTQVTESTWAEYLDQESTPLFNRYPIVVVSSEYYEKYSRQLARKIDNFFFLNVLPKKTFNEEWLTNYMVGYDPAFVELSNRLDTEKVELHNRNALSYNIVKNINGLSLSDTNRAARYLGQEIHKCNSDYRIYQLKNVSIISMWSPAKNVKLLEGLSLEGIKEIIPSGSDNNLLPGILSDTESQKYILIEDNFLKVDSQTKLISQNLLLQELKTAGVNVISLDNYRLIQSGTYSLKQAIRQLQRADQISREPVLS